MKISLAKLTVTLILTTNGLIKKVQSDEYVEQQQAPIILNADSSVLNGKTGLFEHCGNALLTQLNITIKADCINGKRHQDGRYDFIAASGAAHLIQHDQIKNEKLDVKAELIEYKVQEKQFKIENNAELELSNQNLDSVRIISNVIDLNNKNEEKRLISATGTPLKIILKKLGQVDLEAVSNQLIYDTGSSELKLAENVIANLELGQISAGLFEYNSQTKESSFTRSSDQQIEIIQQKKQQP
jgi:lipopolysaccharide transport protein LptA